MMMMMKEDEISRLRAAYTAPVPASWTPGSCPEPDRIWQAVRGELPPDEVRDVVDHVAICASCAEDWRIAVAFEKESQAHDAEEPKKGVVVPFPGRFRTWTAAAAAVLVLTVGGIYVRNTQNSGQKPPRSEYRGERTEIRSLTAESLSRQSFLLRWTPLEGAESYDLLVTTDDLRTIADPKGLTVPEYRIPASALAGLPPGAQLYWRVTAVFPDGSRKQSQTFTGPPL